MESCEQLRKSGLPGYAPLRETWNLFRRLGVLNPVWFNFWTFYHWAIDAGWEPGIKIMRADSAGFAGPNNCRLVRTARRKNPDLPMLWDIRAGHENQPCKMCRDHLNCPSYSNCAHYRAWINECWAGFNRYAKKHGGNHE